MANKSESKKNDTGLTELEWVSLQHEMRAGGSVNEEAMAEKFTRKFKEHPAIPIGCIATATVLCFGLHSFYKGDKRLSQKFMRLRVLAQGLTLGALMFAVYQDAAKK